MVRSVAIEKYQLFSFSQFSRELLRLVIATFSSTIFRNSQRVVCLDPRSHPSPFLLLTAKQWYEAPLYKSTKSLLSQFAQELLRLDLSSHPSPSPSYSLSRPMLGAVCTRCCPGPQCGPHHFAFCPYSTYRDSLGLQLLEIASTDDRPNSGKEQKRCSHNFLVFFEISW